MVTTDPSTSAPLSPLSDPSLVSRIPSVDRYSLAHVPADDVLWQLYDVPPELTDHHAFVVADDGTLVGRLILASGSPGRPAIDLFVEQTFADPLLLPLDNPAVIEDGGLWIASNQAIPSWTEMEGNAVIRAEQDRRELAMGVERRPYGVDYLWQELGRGLRASPVARAGRRSQPLRPAGNDG
jgi:hypothetical protein